MTKNIMIVGVGGQGSLLASKLLGHLLLTQGYDVKVSEVHGMSQRGGSVVTYVRFGEKVYSPIIDKGEADFIVSFEKLEAARWVEYLRDMNLLGHTYKHHFWGSGHWAHNGILWVGYYYGVISIIPYVMMLLLAIVKAAKKIHLRTEKGKYEIVPFGFIVIISLISMGDNAEQPFGVIVWYLLYLMIGFLFIEEREQIGKK